MKTYTDIKASLALKHPRIKRALQCMKMLSKYGLRNWYQYDAEGNITKTPSDRMIDWAYDLEDFAGDLSYDRDKDMAELWEAYCEVNDMDSSIEVSGYFC